MWTAELNESRNAIHFIRLPRKCGRLILGSLTLSVGGVVVMTDGCGSVGIVRDSVTGWSRRSGWSVGRGLWVDGGGAELAKAAEDGAVPVPSSA